MKKIIILFICLFMCSCAKNNTNINIKEVILDEKEPTSYRLSLTMVGDALIHSSIYKDAYDGSGYVFDKMFDELKSELTSDLMYYNQETILGGSSLGLSGYPRFNSPYEFGDTMLSLGFNIVSRANNHTLDKGSSGLLNACNYWKSKENVLTNGSSCSLDEKNNIRILEKNHIKYTLLSYTLSTNELVPENSYDVNIYDEDTVKEDILRVRDKTDIILVAMHWGDEYTSEPNLKQREIAEYLSSLGVNIIIGTHPHVIEPVVFIGDTLVIYSLGNFISSQTNVNDYARLIGLMVKTNIIKTITSKQKFITITNPRYELIYTYYKNTSNYKVIPFSKINDNILPNFNTYKKKYIDIVNLYN